MGDHVVSLKRHPERLDNDGMERIHTRIGVLGVAVMLVAVACAGTGTPPEVALEARWQCDVQRQTFGDLAALDAELDSRLAAAGLTRADYETFKEELATSQTLRDSVSSEYEAYCLSE